MKWLGYLLSVIVAISLASSISFTESPTLFFVPLYAGLLVYWAFRPTWNDRKSAIIKMAIISAIITVLLVIEDLIFRKVSDHVRSVAPLGSNNAIALFSTPGIPFVIGLGAIFVAIPALLAFLDGLTQPDQEGLIRNPLLVLVYLILTLGLYNLYWFWLIKKGLRNSNIQTTSLWWFLLPILGPILIYVDFSEALEQRTKREFVIWFLIFFFFQGLGAVINQAILNHDLRQKV